MYRLFSHHCNQCGRLLDHVDLPHDCSPTAALSKQEPTPETPHQVVAPISTEEHPREASS